MPVYETLQVAARKIAGFSSVINTMRLVQTELLKVGRSAANSALE